MKSMTFDFCNNWTFRKEGGVSVSVNLPHDAMLLEKRDGGCRNGVNSGYFPGGRYTYEKAFELDAAMLGKSVVLHFESVYQNCRVFTDKTGNLKPYVEQKVEITVVGAATLAGFGSALCKTDEVFDKNYHDSYRGRALAVLRAGNTPGKAFVTVNSTGVEPVTVEVEVK